MPQLTARPRASAILVYSVWSVFEVSSSWNNDTLTVTVRNLPDSIFNTRWQKNSPVWRNVQDTRLFFANINFWRYDVRSEMFETDNMVEGWYLACTSPIYIYRPMLLSRTLSCNGKLALKSVNLKHSSTFTWMFRFKPASWYAEWCQSIVGCALNKEGPVSNRCLL
jgi:hypothetical protein